MRLELGGFLDKSFFENRWKMLLELLGSIPPGSIIKCLLEIYRKCSWSSLGQFLHISFYQIWIKNRWKILWELPGPCPLHFFMKPRIKTNRKCSCRFLSQFLQVPCLNRHFAARNLLKMLLELPGPIPLHFFIKSLLKSLGNAHGAWGSPSESLIKLLSTINGKYSWSFLGQILQVPPIIKS